MCFMTKCPYVPPHPWNVDFPHLMLRAKAVRDRKEGVGFRNRALSATDTVGQIAGIPVVAEIVNAVNRSSLGRVVLEKTLGVDRDAPIAGVSLPHGAQAPAPPGRAVPAPRRSRLRETTGKVALFTTCYGNRNEPRISRRIWSPCSSTTTSR